MMERLGVTRQAHTRADREVHSPKGLCLWQLTKARPHAYNFIRKEGLEILNSVGDFTQRKKTKTPRYEIKRRAAGTWHELVP